MSGRGVVYDRQGYPATLLRPGHWIVLWSATVPSAIEQLDPVSPRGNALLVSNFRKEALWL